MQRLVRGRAEERQPVQSEACEACVSGGVTLAQRAAGPGDRALAAGVNARDREGWAQPGSWERSLIEWTEGKTGPRK